MKLIPLGEVKESVKWLGENHLIDFMILIGSPLLRDSNASNFEIGDYLTIGDTDFPIYEIIGIFKKTEGVVLHIKIIINCTDRAINREAPKVGEVVWLSTLGSKNA